jgi:large conductance mechanosensitive channel
VRAAGGRLRGAAHSDALAASPWPDAGAPASEEVAMLKEFRDFIARGNVIDLAVAVVIGAAFGKIVSSFVEGILMPPIGLLLGHVNFENLFVALDQSKGVPSTLAAAKADAIPVLAYGAFINDVVNFLIIAFAIFIVVKQVNRFKAAPPPPDTRDCPLCLSSIPLKARRCPHCCADVQPAA